MFKTIPLIVVLALLVLTPVSAYFILGHSNSELEKLRQKEILRTHCCQEEFKTNLKNAGNCSYIPNMHDEHFFGLITDYESSYYSCYKDGKVEIIRLQIWCEKPCESDYYD